MPALKPRLPILNRSHPLARGLIGAWLGYEGAGVTEPRDASGYRRHATNSQNVTWVNGKYGRALKGTTQSAAIFTPSLPMGTYITAFALARATADPATAYGNDGLMGQWGNGDAFTIWTTTSNALDYTMLTKNNSGSTSSASTTTVRDNNWHSITGVFDGASKIYIDGNLKATGSSIGGVVNSDTGDMMLLNYSNSPTNLGFVGEVACFYMFNRSLSASEIRALHADPYQAFRPYISIVPPLIATAALSTVQLSWQDNSSNETLFSVERSTTSATAGFAEIDTVAANTTSYNDTDLAAGTYWYRVRSYDGSEYSDYSNVAEVTVS